MGKTNRSEAIRVAQARARAAGKKIGRPRAVLDPDTIIELRRQGYSWRQIARRTGLGVGTIRRSYGQCARPRPGPAEALWDPFLKVHHRRQ